MKALIAIGIIIAFCAAPSALTADGNGSEAARLSAVILPAPRGEISLEEVLSAAARKREREAADIEAAQAQVRLLESANRRRFDLKPELGLVSFSNPLLLATSMGFSLLSGSPSNATRFALETARVDLLLADESGRRAALRRRILVSRQYFELAEKQQAAARVCGSVPDLEAGRPRVHAMAGAGKLTAVDELRFEQEILERRTGCVQAREQRGAAALLMATTAGLTELDPQVAEPGEVADFDEGLPQLDVLVRIAFAHRPERTMVEDEMAAVRTQVASQHKNWLPALQVGFSRLSNTTAINNGDSLLGGNIVHPGMIFNIPLRDTGERAAERELIAARVRRLDTELGTIEEDILTELANARLRAGAAAERLHIARQRLELASRSRELVAVRFENGLSGPEELFAAERDESLRGLEAMQAGYESTASLHSIVVLCGVSRLPPSERRLVFAANAPEGTDAKEGIRNGGY
jgi:outer membrane efflux protein